MNLLTSLRNNPFVSLGVAAAVLASLVVGSFGTATYTAMLEAPTEPPTQTALPTYTPLPSQTPLATYTPLATLTRYPTYTPPATRNPLPTYTPPPTLPRLPTYTPFPTPSVLDWHLNYSTISAIGQYRCGDAGIEPLPVRVYLTPITTHIWQEIGSILGDVAGEEWREMAEEYLTKDFMLALLYIDLENPARPLSQPFNMSTLHAGLRSYNELSFDFAVINQSKIEVLSGTDINLTESSRFPLPSNMHLRRFYPIVIDLEGRTPADIQAQFAQIDIKLILTLPYLTATCEGNTQTFRLFPHWFSAYVDGTQTALRFGTVAEAFDAATLTELRLEVLTELFRFLQGLT